MDLRPLGTTGIKVSVVGLGTVKIGRTQGLKHPGTSALPSDDEVVELLNEASRLGINLIDTAPAYGTSESRLGRLLPGRRDEWILSTKCGEEFGPQGSMFDFTPEATRASIERSLLRLGTDHVDIALIHSDGNDRRIIEDYGTLAALEELQTRGLVRAIGISTKTIEGALLAIEQSNVVMVTLNPIETDDLPAVQAASERGVGVLIKKALASGHLHRITDDPNVDPVRESVRFVLEQPGVSSVIVGTTNPAHLQHTSRVAAGRDSP